MDDLQTDGYEVNKLDYPLILIFSSDYAEVLKYTEEFITTSSKQQP